MSYSLHLKPRVRRVRPIIGLRTRENDQNYAFQIGVTTYSTDDSGDETYQVSYYEQSVRCDHLNDLIDSWVGDDVTVRRVADADADDRIYAGTPAQNRASAERQAAKADKPAAKPADEDID